MPHESSANLSDDDIERTVMMWRYDESYRRDLDFREDLDKGDRLLEGLNQDRETREAEEAARPGPQFEIHPKAQAILDARRKDYDRHWETEAAKSTPITISQLNEKIEKSGKRREPPTAEEVEAQEQERLARLRAEAAERNGNNAGHATKAHKPRTSSSKVLWRPRGSIQRDIASNDLKVKETYQENDQLSL